MLLAGASMMAEADDTSAPGQVDATRHLLWRAFQRGELSLEEFALSVQRLEYGRPDAQRRDLAEDR